MKKYLVEFVGTFFLVLTIGSTVMAPGEAGALAPLAIGAVLMTMVFAGGHVSGAHYNPAVTVAVFLRGKCAASEVPGYIVAQCVGATLAAATVAFLKGYPAVSPMQIDVGRALVAEFLYTFALCTVVLNVATSRGTTGNSFYGLAIGFTVMAGAYSVGAVSGGAFNPAVALGATMMGLFSATNIWVYLVANFAAAAVAAAFFKLTEAESTV
ncbi:MAG: porin [Acidobacteria bacterium]|nr:porin [Acidobacteriota bacterium]